MIKFPLLAISYNVMLTHIAKTKNKITKSTYHILLIIQLNIQLITFFVIFFEYLLISQLSNLMNPLITKHQLLIKLMIILFQQISSQL